MAYIDARLTVVEKWIREAPVFDDEEVCRAVEACLPHDVQGRLVADEVVKRVTKPDLFYEHQRRR